MSLLHSSNNLRTSDSGESELSHFVNPGTCEENSSKVRWGPRAVVGWRLREGACRKSGEELVERLFGGESIKEVQKVGR